MAKPRILLVISDFHLGAGPVLPDGRANYLEDFYHDAKLVEFLEYHMRDEYAKAEVELVINGDFFNQLQVYPDEDSPDQMTEARSIIRTEAIMAGHPSVFEAMRRFAEAPRHSIRFMIGNHDAGLMWSGVKNLIERTLGENVRVHSEAHYFNDGVWIEHGNQHVAENWMDFKSPFVVGANGERIVDLPWGSIFVIKYLNIIKRGRPYVDKVFPFGLYLKWAFLHDTMFAIKSTSAGCVYFIKELMARGELGRLKRKKVIRLIKEFSFPVRLEKAAKKIFATNPEARVVVLGHGHQMAARLFAGGREYFNTGIWNEMTSLDIGTMGRAFRPSFVEIRYDRHGIPHGWLREWKGVYREVEDIGLV